MFQELHSFEFRKEESKRIRHKYKDRVPCIIQKSRVSRLPPFSKIKYLVSSSSTMNDVVYYIRNHIKLEPHQSIFFTIKDNLLPISMQVSLIDKTYCDKDGFVYIYYSEESTFG
jgi:GABA(A) receptor-associated protein